MEIEKRPIIDAVGFYIQRDGVIICPNGRRIEEAYPSGQVCLNGRSVMLDKVVAVAFCERPDYTYRYVIHHDGNRDNCHADNLEWSQKRARRLMRKTVTEEDRVEIIMLWTMGKTVDQINKKIAVRRHDLLGIISDFEASLKSMPER